MESHNSKGEFKYLLIVEALYRDIAQRYRVSNNTQRTELKYIRSRYASEGLSFLTKGLPRYAKALDRALANGTQLAIEGFELSSRKLTGFADGLPTVSRCTFHSPVPKFLGWLVSYVFNEDGYARPWSSISIEDGVLRHAPYALKHLRQLLYVVYKLEIAHDSETAQAVIEAFVDAENQVDLLSQNWESVVHDNRGWIIPARNLITRVVSVLDPDRIKPKHGPGAVATGESTTEKSNFSRIYENLERVYPFMEWFRFNLSHVAESWARDQDTLEVRSEATARVVLVPKDSRGPRLISCEPLEIQWIQ
jgi:hypothetical protein